VKKLVVNADDYGMAIGVNRGIIDGHRNGILTSATIMANGDALTDGVARLKDAPDLATGCHLVLLDGSPVAPATDVRSLTDVAGRFPNTLSAFMSKVTTGRVKYEEIVTEFRAQLDSLGSRGVTIDHLDSHKHSHAHPLVLNAVIQVAEEYQIPYVRNPFEWERLRTARAWGGGDLTRRWAVSKALGYYRHYFNKRMRDTSVACPDRFLGFIATGYLSPAMVALILAQASDGVTELMCHPAHLDDDLRGAHTRLKESRERELSAVTSPVARAALRKHGLELTTFQTLAKERT
jgi:hopanoid biosynthesis associated protein HpnK